MLFILVSFVPVPCLLFAQDKPDKPITEEEAWMRLFNYQGQKTRAQVIAEWKDEGLIKQDKEKWYEISISGTIYMEYAHSTGYDGMGSSFDKVWKYLYDFDNATGVLPYNISRKNNDAFRMKRVYLNFEKNIGDIISVRVTTDIDPTGYDFIYLKFGYVKIKKGWGPVTLEGQAGKIVTPVIGLISKISDYRWLNNDYIDHAKYVLNGHSFDNSADLGGKFSIDLFKKVNLTYAITNGEGFKKDNDETYDGKCHYALVTITPIDKIYINAFGRWEDTNANQIDSANGEKFLGIESRNYMGAGAAWKSDLLKIGANIVFPEKQ